MAKPRKARVEGAQAINPAVEPIVGHPAADDLAAIVKAFRERYPEEWARIDRSPTENGIDHMIAVLSR